MTESYERYRYSPELLAKFKEFLIKNESEFKYQDENMICAFRKRKSRIVEFLKKNLSLIQNEDKRELPVGVKCKDKSGPPNQLGFLYEYSDRYLYSKRFYLCSRVLTGFPFSDEEFEFSIDNYEYII